MGINRFIRPKSGLATSHEDLYTSHSDNAGRLCRSSLDFGMDQLSFEDNPQLIHLRTAWANVLQRLASDAPKGMLDNFLRKLQPLRYEDGCVEFRASSRFVMEWIQKKFQGRLESMLSDELGEEIKLNLSVGTWEKAPLELAVQNVAPAAVKPTSQSGFKPNPRYSFENFVIGQSNRFAVAGAMAVSNEPGSRLNPLFIYGPSGMGKTHLLHAIASSVLQRDPNYSIAYVSGQQFVEDFVAAIQSNRVEQFRRAHRNVGLWLVDDIQFIAGRDKTQEEFFHTFNYLHSLGKQIVLISDQAPRSLRITDERLVSRFESGLVADIQPPDTETRCAIILSKAAQDKIDIEPEVAMYLAESVQGNVRVLEGVLTRVATQASVLNVPLTIEFAKQVVEQHYGQTKSARPNFQQILDVVSKEFKISIDDIKGTRRHAPIVHARHVAIFITREMTGDSWKHIGTLFGDRDHTSMIHAHSKISDLVRTDREFRQQMKQIMRGLQPE